MGANDDSKFYIAELIQRNAMDQDMKTNHYNILHVYIQVED